eukprot:CAMPEP_0184295664 /NCGR_PEP_ID=MMETSP1049-20130417/6530_1 /TAXON_ID=77928 /ORGANISM="Proteomonas sulcata, Strain CCMP704" /LENGTH=255 /DNA_ID=CAMNT_0026604333 /DNA_START=1 /DNA_END=768 /DNA_ORIENTATION=+
MQDNSARPSVVETSNRPPMAEGVAPPPQNASQRGSSRNSLVDHPGMRGNSNPAGGLSIAIADTSEQPISVESVNDRPLPQTSPTHSAATAGDIGEETSETAHLSNVSHSQRKSPTRSRSGSSSPMQNAVREQSSNELRRGSAPVVRSTTTSIEAPLTAEAGGQGSDQSDKSKDPAVPNLTRKLSVRERAAQMQAQMAALSGNNSPTVPRPVKPIWSSVTPQSSSARSGRSLSDAGELVPSGSRTGSTDTEVREDS